MRRIDSYPASTVLQHSHRRPRQLNGTEGEEGSPGMPICKSCTGMSSLPNSPFIRSARRPGCAIGRRGQSEALVYSKSNHGKLMTPLLLKWTEGEAWGLKADERGEAWGLKADERGVFLQALEYVEFAAFAACGVGSLTVTPDRVPRDTTNITSAPVVHDRRRRNDAAVTRRVKTRRSKPR